MALVPRVLELLKEQGQADVPVLVGGIIPNEDVTQLEELGVKGIFGPGTSMNDAVESVRQAVLAASTARD
jgi:methylmalonyl-CoA mutase C-terminal domain/subunit